MRQRRNRMPVVGVKVREGPNKVARIQAADDVSRAIHIIAVVITDPVEARAFSENNPDEEPKHDANRKPRLEKTSVSGCAAAKDHRLLVTANRRLYKLRP